MNILFVCNGNVARSQEAEAFFNATKSNVDDVATSGGINVKLDKPIDPFVVDVMKELGYDLSSAKRKFATEVMVRSANRIVSFKPANELPDFIREHEDIIYWQVADPQHRTIAFHRGVRDEVQSRVAHLLEES